MLKRNILFLAVIFFSFTSQAAFAQYRIKASEVRPDVSRFSGILSSSDSDVQKALDTIDDLIIPSPDLSLYAQKTEAFLLDQDPAQRITGLSDGYLKLTSGVIGTGAIDVSGLVAKTDTRTVSIGNDIYGNYIVSPNIRIPMPDIGYGYDLKTVSVKCWSADPTTELNADLMYADAQTTGAFPGANQTVIMAIDSTTGNFTWSGTSTVATAKDIYIRMNANVDYGVFWTIVITYSLRLS